MPGWFVHMEAAHQTAQRLRAGQVAPPLPITAAEATELGEICHRWRNYLAVGSLGPDLFYLLPDFANTKGCVIRQVIQWALEVWREIDAEFVSKWEKWIEPISTNASQLASQLTGGLSAQLGQILDELAAAIMNAFKGLLAQMADWFGILTSGPPQGFDNDAFFWSDVFHYRRTYQFPFVLYQQARTAFEKAQTDDERGNAEAQIAFAVGWLSHCATDVTGHPFTNAKCGGPYRDHWQRHHLVENHIDSQNYGALHPGPLYGEYGTSALHFWVAFRRRTGAPYAGRADGPAYDYFTGLPAYNNADGPTPAAERSKYFGLTSEQLPNHLIDALHSAMAKVHPDGPKILTQDPQFSATGPDGGPDGRPNADAMGQMWEIVYRYLKMTSSDGLSPRKPSPPDLFTDHSFPTPPGGGGGVDDDPARGADVDDNDFNVLDLLMALFAWAVYLAEVALWIATVLPGLIADIATFPAREVIYWALVVPAWNLMMLARRTLVMAGFLMPKPEEIDLGLTTLGTSGGFNIAAALNNPFGQTGAGFQINEPSGRLTPTSNRGLDPAYPRNIVRDTPDTIGDAALVSFLAHSAKVPYTGDADEFKASEWIAPWRYPITNQAGQGVPRENDKTHVGPYVVGDTSTVLLPGTIGDHDARDELEKATDPSDTAARLTALLSQNRHLGGPVDYSLYLVSRMVDERDKPVFEVPDFNLDSDRGYAWHCWDWDRHTLGRDADPDARGEWECIPDIAGTKFNYAQPCTVPQFFDGEHDNPRHPLQFDPQLNLAAHYLSRDGEMPASTGPDPCQITANTDGLVDGLDWRRRIDDHEGER